MKVPYAQTALSQYQRQYRFSTRLSDCRELTERIHVQIFGKQLRKLR